MTIKKHLKADPSLYKSEILKDRIHRDSKLSDSLPRLTVLPGKNFMPSLDLNRTVGSPSESMIIENNSWVGEQLN